jgi:flavin reductase (DIM6/NTAB) family NADH-FMN oxidoreductase RutF
MARTIAIDPKARRNTLRMISNGVYVLTARSDGRIGAATVSWVSQASFKPPLIMAAVRRDSNVFRCLAESGSAALHIVGEQQQDIARRFFFPTHVQSGTINGEPFAEGRLATPVLTRLPAHIECTLEHVADVAGDHAIVVLRAIDVECRERVRPLTIAASPWEYGG